MSRKCWFCRNRAEGVDLVHFSGRWRNACPPCQAAFADGSLKGRR